MERGDLGEAEKEIREAIKTNSQDALSHGMLGEILEKKNDIAGAVKQMEECVRLGDVPGNRGKARLATLRAKLAKLETTQ